ncbi:MAG: aldehyde dehydrogenase family protein [Deltaproteobacteria bacterium]|nr:aldehyde dehydrogenase family protein [Deltaproteobacteria bacterium]
MFIGGEWVDSCSGQMRSITDPANQQLINRVPEADQDDVNRAIAAARTAFDKGPWRQTTAQDRGKILFAVGQKIRERAVELAELEVKNCGKPLAEAQFDIQDAANCFEFYGGLATKIHGETMSVPADSLSFVLREPIGVCGQIIPWIFCEVGLPPGVVNVVTGPGPGCGEVLASSPFVDKVAFTGGTATGQKVMAGVAKELKRISLELGGKSPNIVFADADREAAVDGALFAAFANQGEVCSAGSRLLVEESIHREFIAQMLAKIPKIKLGHGLIAGTKMGPLISYAQLEKVESYVKIGVEEGAKLLCGGKRPKGLEAGFFFEPTIFDGVTPKMRIAREEIFGPVLSILTFKDEAEAIAMANDTEYGLAAGVWTKDIHRSLRLVRGLRAGIVWVNAYHPTYNELPWGGYKKSGLGRELGLHGIEEYLETKQVNFHGDPAPINWY